MRNAPDSPCGPWQEGQHQGCNHDLRVLNVRACVRVCVCACASPLGLVPNVAVWSAVRKRRARRVRRRPSRCRAASPASKGPPSPDSTCLSGSLRTPRSQKRLTSLVPPAPSLPPLPPRRTHRTSPLPPPPLLLRPYRTPRRPSHSSSAHRMLRQPQTHLQLQRLLRVRFPVVVPRRGDFCRRCSVQTLTPTGNRCPWFTMGPSCRNLGTVMTTPRGTHRPSASVATKRTSSSA